MLDIQNNHCIIAATTKDIQNISVELAPVAQLDRALGYELRGREFESLRVCHMIKITE